MGKQGKRHKKKDAEAEARQIEALRAQLEASAARAMDAEGKYEASEARAMDAESKLEAAEIVICKTLGNVYLSGSHGLKRFSTPKLMLNSSVEPSNKGHNHGSNEKTSAPLTAKIKFENDEKYLPKLDANNFPYLDVNGKLLPSHLGAHTLPLRQYQNEADVQNFVACLVQDAIRACGLEDIVEMHLEMSMFSVVPDLVVVKIRQHGILCIEVKSPERKDGEVFSSEEVAYQVFSYCMLLKRLGHEFPVVSLTTYNKLCLVTLPDPSHDLSKCEEIKEKIQTQLSNCKVQPLSDEVSIKGKSASSPFRKLRHLAQHKDANESQYPDQISNGAGLTAQTDAQTLETTDTGIEEYEVLPAAVGYGQIYEDDNVFQHLCSTLLYAVNLSSKLDVLTELPIVKDGESLGNQVYPLVSEAGCVWVKTSPNLKATINMFPQSNAAKFLLLTPLGQGGTGKVFLASTLQGLLCAAKLYIPPRSNRFSAQENEDEMKKRLKEKAEIRDLELNRWMELYKSKRKGKLLYGFIVRSVELNGLPSLLMPYGKPLSTLVERNGALNAIQALLESFAAKGYCYKNGDLRWRHVLSSAGGDIFFVDLESLCKFKDVDANAVVNLQLKELKTRIDPDTGDAA